MERHRYTEEEKEFLAEYLRDHSFPQTAREFNGRYGVSVAPHTLEVYCRSMGLKSGGVHNLRGYTEEEAAYMKSLAGQCSNYDEAYKAFCARFPARSRSAFVGIYRKLTGAKYGNPRAYSDEQDAWLRMYAPVMVMDQLTDEYNRTFNENKTQNAIACRIKTLRIDRSSSPIKGKTRYTDEICKFVLEHSKGRTNQEVADLVNEQFGVHVNAWSISALLTKRLKSPKGENRGRFAKGHVPGWNRYKVGDECVGGAYDYTLVKVGDEAFSGKQTYAQRKQNWIPKQRYVYMQRYGEIPDGWVVIFLDGDRMNFAPENLYAVSRNVHARMNQNHWYTGSREHTLTAIKLCILNELLEEEKNGKRKNTEAPAR